MRFRYLACLLLVSLTYGQATPPVTAPAASAKTDQSPSTDQSREVKAPEPQVGPDDTVITIKGFCIDTTLQGDACKTLITRAQFEKLAEALQPGMSPAIRRQLATAYARVLKMSAAAEKRGLDKQPTFDEKMYFARMQILSQELSRTLQEESNKPADSEVEAYYKKNIGSYQQATLARIVIPRTKQLSPTVEKPKAGAGDSVKGTVQPPTEAQRKAAEEAMTKLAADLRARAAQGEDPEKLQKEAYADAGFPGNAPSTKMENVRRNSLPTTHQMVFDLKPGEVSEVISDPNSSHYIYKMITIETLPLDAVKTEIQRIISSEHYRESMQGFQGNVDLSDAYFGPAPRPTAMPLPPRGVKPPSDQPAPDPD
jgi:PPIC-type PPIASE domain